MADGPRRVRVAVLGALVAWMCAAPPRAWAEAAAAFVAAHPDFGLAFSQAWRELLRTVPELAEHRRFVHGRASIGLIFEDPGGRVADDTAAAYSDAEKVVRVNRRRLAEAGAALIERGVRYEDAAGILAWKMLPILAHELRHGMTARDLGPEAVCDHLVLENEILGYRDQARFAVVALRRRPDAFRDQVLLDTLDRDTAELVRADRAGPDALESLVAGVEPEKASVLRLSRAELLRLSEEKVARSRRAQDAWSAAGPSEREPVLRELGPDTERLLRRAVARSEACRDLLASPDRYKRMRSLYAREAASGSPQAAAP